MVYKLHPQMGIQRDQVESHRAGVGPGHGADPGGGEGEDRQVPLQSGHGVQLPLPPCASILRLQPIIQPPLRLK